MVPVMAYSLRSLIDVKLGSHRNVNRWLTTQKRAGKSLRDIAAELSELSGVAVSYEAIRRWCRELGI